MPEILERLRQQMKARGVEEPHTEAVAHLQRCGILKEGSDTELTPFGVIRNNMTPAQRAADRAAKRSGGRHHQSDYGFNPETNSVKLKRR